MSATLCRSDEAGGGTVTPHSRSVSLGTDLSMADIENLQKEIIELRKEVALRDTKLRQITEEHETEGSENVISPPFPWTSQPDSILITWHHGNSPEGHHMLPNVKEEPSLEIDPILITRQHDNLSEGQNHNVPPEDFLPKVKQEPAWAAVCKTELNCPQINFESHHCQPKLENVATVHKTEAEPIEITLSVHDGGIHHALHRCSDPARTESLGSGCAGGDQHTVQTPVKMCSVRLVDCRKTMELNENVVWRNLEVPGEPSQLSSDLIPAVQTIPPHDIQELSQANTKNKRKHAQLYSCSSHQKPTVNPSGPRSGAQDEESYHRCRFCSVSFTTDFNLHRHLKLHAGEKPHQCSRCGKHFAQLFNLTAHQRVHTGEKPYQCSVCRKHFSQASKLKTHKRIHTGEKPYICHACGKGFSDSSTYHKHQRIHTGERPYTCSVCGKCFGQSAHLLKHTRSHNRKPYNCSICGKNFSKPLSLVKHKTSHSANGNTN